MPSETETGKEKESLPRKLLKLFLKIGITVLCFWYISQKIDFSKAFDAMAGANWALLFLAVVCYVLSKIVAAYRLNIYFKNINLHLSQWVNGKLYWLGMFYNLFLPGSISGDAYKVVLLNKKLKAPYKKTGAAMLLDRFSGLLGLGILLSIYGSIVLKERWLVTVLVAGCFVSLIVFYIVVKKFFSDFLQGFWPTLFLGLVVQAVQVVGVYFILLAVKVPLNSQWIAIFLTASVVSVLPLSLGGGLGTREVVFAEGATYFHLDPHVGVLISLLFYVSSVLGSLPGAWFIFHDPLQASGKD